MTFSLHHAALAASILLTVGSQILLKLGTSCKSGRLNGFILAGLVSFGLVTVLIVYALQAVEMKTLIAFNALIYVVMPVAARHLLRENVSARQLAGSLLILLGILVFLTGG